MTLLTDDNRLCNAPMSMTAPDNLPPPIRTDGTNEFAYNTMRLRHPKMIWDLLEANPHFSDVVKEQLYVLREDLENNAPIPMLNLYPSPPPDYIDWASAFIDRRSMYSPRGTPTWLGVDWLFAETMLFRMIIEAVRWWELRQDPFTPIKEEELNNSELWTFLETALTLDGGVIDRLPSLVKFAMWGNRIDLSYAASTEQGTQAEDSDVLVDDCQAVTDHMLRAQLDGFPHGDQGISHIIVDNAGTELAMDLALVDALLTGFSDVVIMHTKYHPTYVSDATPHDVRHMINRCAIGNHSGSTSAPIMAMGQRLQDALHTGRLRLAPHLFWNSPNFLWEMPQILQRVFDDAQIVILKGDANYRRAVGDAMWETTIPFAHVTGYFPAPLLALRTLKSDPVVGLPDGISETLYDEDSNWRINGKRGVIQLKV